MASQFAFFGGADVYMQAETLSKCRLTSCSYVQRHSACLKRWRPSVQQCSFQSFRDPLLGPLCASASLKGARRAALDGELHLQRGGPPLLRLLALEEHPSPGEAQEERTARRDVMGLKLPSQAVGPMCPSLGGESPPGGWAGALWACCVRLCVDIRSESLRPNPRTARWGIAGLPGADQTSSGTP